MKYIFKKFIQILIMTKALIFDFGRTVYDKDNKKLFRGVIVFLKYCKRNGYKLALISNDEPGRRELINDLNLGGYFDKIIVTKEKGEGDFRKCISDFGLEPKDVVVIGDRVKKEIKIGNRIGAVTAWFKHGKYAREEPKEDDEKPDHIIISLSQLYDFI